LSIYNIIKLTVRENGNKETGDMKGKFKRILYGGDYNPNQWPKNICQEDMRIFKDARINSATIVFTPMKPLPGLSKEPMA